MNFSAVEQLDEAARALGWNIDYRQMGRGAFSANLNSVESENGFCLSTERFDNHIHTHSEPPNGFIGIFLPRLDSASATACGNTIQDGEVVVFPARSELEIATQGVLTNETLFMPETVFRAAFRSLVPTSKPICEAGSAAILSGDKKRFREIQNEMAALHGISTNGLVDPESASTLLASTIQWIADATSHAMDERLSNGSATAVARRARTYIEEHLRDAIRLSDLCDHVGVSLRTLQRCFASQYQMTPIDYIRARRLNFARRDLVAADPQTCTVTEIAMESGFMHFGRFSVQYREHFGESPSETLAG